jgi:hypothetical protein
MSLVEDDAVGQLDATGRAPKPVTDPNDSLKKAVATLNEYSTLVAQINHTNDVTTLPNGATNTQAIASRDATLKYFSIFERPSHQRARAGQVLFLDVALLRHTADQMARNARELDELIQKANWTTELIV